MKHPNSEKKKPRILFNSVMIGVQYRRHSGNQQFYAAQCLIDGKYSTFTGKC